MEAPETRQLTSTCQRYQPWLSRGRLSLDNGVSSVPSFAVEVQQAPRMEHEENSPAAFKVDLRLQLLVTDGKFSASKRPR